MKVSTQKNIGKNLRTLRVHNNLNQMDMAGKAGLTRSLYAQYELGNRTPDAEVLYHVAMLFGLDMEIFFEPDPERFIARLSCARILKDEEAKLVCNYSRLSPFSQGILLEKSNQLLEWDRSRQMHLHNLQQSINAE